MVLRDLDEVSEGQSGVDPSAAELGAMGTLLRIFPSDSAPSDSEAPDSEAPDSEAPDSEAPDSDEPEPVSPAIPSFTCPTFESLYSRYFDDVYRSLALLGVPSSTREDAAQDVFVVVHRRLKDFEGRSSARTWVLGIARRVASQHRRSGFREWRRRDAWAREAVCIEHSLEGVIENRQAAEVLEAFLETLDLKQREAFVLGAVQGLGRTEMGKVLGVNPNTAYSRLRLARARFKERVLDPDAQADLLREWRDRRENPTMRRRVWALLPVYISGGRTAIVAGKIQAITKVAAIFACLVGTPVLVSKVLDTPEVDTPVVEEGFAGAPTASIVDSAMKSKRPRGPAPAPALPAAAPEFPLAQPSLELAPVPSTTRPLHRTERVAPAAPKNTENLEELSAELTVLRRAREAQEAGNRAGAAAALAEHRRRFPRGRLAVDRDFMEGSAACKSGTELEITEVVAGFAKRYPGTPQAIRLAQICAR